MRIAESPVQKCLYANATAVAATILSVHVALLAWSAVRNSPVAHEVAHLPAGISHWSFGRFDLYSVNPPLVRMFASLPVLISGYQSNWGNYIAHPGHRSEFPVGRDFIWANGNRSFKLYTFARWTCIPFSLIGGWTCYQWAKQLYGPLGGLLALMLWCACPNVLGHGPLIMPDLAAASLGLAAMYHFWRWLHCFQWKSAMAAGLILGLALLTKLSWIILLPLWPVIWLGWSLTMAKPRAAWRLTYRQAAQLVAAMIIAIYVLNAGYGFQGTGTRLGEFQFVSRLLAGSTERNASGNRFDHHLLGSLPVLLPMEYVAGIDRQERDFEHFNELSYLRGEWRASGWWYYYLYAMAVKIPLGTWALLCLVVATFFVRHQEGPSWRDEFILLAPPSVLILTASLELEFNHHLRYVLPAFPFVYVWVARLAVSARRSRIVTGLAVVAIVWTTVSSLMSFPHSLSYFNELAGGPKHGAEHLLHSNMDWGQDLLYLRTWIHDHPEARPLFVKYYGGFDSEAVGVLFSEPPTCGIGTSGCKLQAGWYAISANLTRGMPWQGHRFGDYAYFQSRHPIASAGYSIPIYRIYSDEILANGTAVNSNGGDLSTAQK